jgi:hypothetical protein
LKVDKFFLLQRLFRWIACAVFLGFWMDGLLIQITSERWAAAELDNQR